MDNVSNYIDREGAALAVRRQTTLFVGISPQDALAVSAKQTSGGCRGRVRAVLEQFIRDVDTVRDATGADLRPHFLRGDDPDLNVAALKLGFASIAARCPEHSPYSNANFVRSALSRARPYGAAIEAEIRPVDVADRGRRDATDPEDLRFLLNVVEPDYVAVDVGQHHSYDRSFDSALAASRGITELDEVHAGADDIPSAFDACLELQAELAARGYARASDERRTVDKLQEELASGQHSSVGSWLETAEAKLPVAAARSLVEFEQRWLGRRLAVVDQRARLYVAMLGHDVKAGDGVNAALDLKLLGQLRRIAECAGTSVVIHGGSSIRSEDLRQLHCHGWHGSISSYTQKLWMRLKTKAAYLPG